MISSHYTWCDHATKCQGSVWLKMKALIKLEAPELDEASSSSQSCTGILFTIQDPTAQVCRLKFQTLVGFRWVSEWASKANLLKFSWPGALMILRIPLQRKVQLSGQDERYVGQIRSQAPCLQFEVPRTKFAAWSSRYPQTSYSMLQCTRWALVDALLL